MAASPGSGLVAACDDKRLLRFSLWPRQRELLALVEQEIQLHVWCLGRRSGKTTLAALVALWDCLLRPQLDGRVRPGERRYAVAVPTSQRQARLFVQAAASIVQGSPLLRPMVESVTDDMITRNGTALAAFPCTARGWPISTLLMDESAFFLSETDGPVVVDAVFNALVPATLQFGDQARVIVASTPFGSDGFFAKLYQQVSNGELVGAHAEHATTVEMNPTVDEEILRQERERDPDSYAANTRPSSSAAA